MATLTQRRFKGKVARATLLDACGGIVHGASSTAVTKGFVKAVCKPTYQDGTDYLVRNANDELEINEQGLPLLRWWEVTLDFVNVDPAWVTITTGSPLVLDENANIIGWRGREGVTNQFALELWANLAGTTCVVGSTQYGYALLPFLVNGMISGDVTFENATATFSITAHTHNAAGWGQGPYNIRLNASNSNPSPLFSAIGALDHFHTEVTSVAPPTPTVGAVNLP